MAIVEGYAEVNTPNYTHSDGLVVAGIENKYPSFYFYLDVLQILFGFGASQNKDYLYIDKRDFLTLDKNSSSKAESLLIALLLNIEHYSKFDKTFNLEVEYWKKYFFNRNDINYVIDTFILDLYAKVDYEYGVAVKTNFQPLLPKDF